jgi:hypothetical protein
MSRIAHVGPRIADPPVVLAVDHLFIGDESDGFTDGLYRALGALDAECPEAIMTLSALDLHVLVEWAERWADSLEGDEDERAAVRAAARRVRHVLERRSD